jgi:hypothetical protein
MNTVKIRTNLILVGTWFDTHRRFAVFLINCSFSNMQICRSQEYLDQENGYFLTLDYFFLPDYWLWILFLHM